MPNKDVSEKIPQRNPQQPLPQEEAPASRQNSEEGIRQAHSEFEKIRSEKAQRDSNKDVISDEESDEIEQEIAEKEMHHPQM